MQLGLWLIMTCFWNWYFDLNGGEYKGYLAFSLSKHKYPITSYMNGVICVQLVNNATFNTIVIRVKEKCEDVDQGFILKLEKWFP